MNLDTLDALRNLLKRQERQSDQAAGLYAYEQEFNQQAAGISVVVPVRNGATELRGLLHSLINQSLSRQKFEVIFSLNDCQDDSAAAIKAALAATDLQFVLFESETPGISRARNQALKRARYRYTTFADHDDMLSGAYLEELLRLSDDRSIVVSNIQQVNNGKVEPDYAQQLMRDCFAVSHVHSPQEIDLCFRAYTLNAIKVAPTYMLRRIRYDQSMDHCEDVSYWRDVFHTFTPITVKSPGWRDIYYRRVRPQSASRRPMSLADWAEPRLAILKRIEAESDRYEPRSPQLRFDRMLGKLLRQNLADRGL